MMAAVGQEIFPAAYRAWKPAAGASPLWLENPPPWLDSGGEGEDPVGAFFAAPVFAFAAQLLLPAVLAAGAIVGGGLLLEKELGIDPGRIPLSAVLGGSGAAAFVVTGSLPESLRPVSLIAGIGLSAASLAILFTKSVPEEARPAPPLSPPPEEQPRDAGEIELVVDPGQAGTGGLSRASSLDQEIEFSVRNLAGRRLSFFAGLLVWSPGLFLWRSKNDPGAFGRVSVDLAPGEAKVFRATFPAINSLQGWSLFGTFGAFAVEVELFRTAQFVDNTPFVRTLPLSMSWGPFGLG